MNLEYPPTRREPVTETIGGIAFEDAYEWLEPENDETAAWQAAQRDVAVQYVRGLPHFARFHRMVADASVDVRVWPPRFSGGRWFRLTADGGEQPVLVVSDEPLGDGNPVVDPNELSRARGIAVALDWWYPSPDGRYVAYGLSEGGNEQSVLHIVDVASRTVLPERIAGTTHCVVAWRPDNKGFFYNGIDPAKPAAGFRIWSHQVGATPPEVPEDVDLSGAFLPFVAVTNDGRYALLMVGHYRFRPAAMKDLGDPDAPWVDLLREIDGHVVGDVVGDHYVALTTIGAPRGRVVSIPLATAADPQTWRDVVPTGDAVLRNLSFTAGGRLVLSALVDGACLVTVHGADGRLERELPVPGDGALVGTGHANATLPWEALATASPRTSLVTFVYTAVDTSPAVYAFDVESGEVTALSKPAVHIDGVVTRRAFATAPDGTRVPMTIVHRDDLDLAEPQPTLLFGYGGFNVVFFPAYSAEFLSWVRAGGVFVLANLRGGGEYGEEWWEAGRKANKQNTFDDLYAVAEHLIAERVTRPDLLAIEGGSNGGLLTGVAITQRPDLFGAVVSIVPVYDLMRGTQDPFTGYVIVNEYGNPWDPEEAKWVRAYSPCHNVRESASYPATLIVAGDRDMRCPAWHARKLAAQLQHAQAGDAPIVLLVQAEAGHGPGRPSSEQVTAAAEHLAFIAAHTATPAFLDGVGP